MSTDVVLVLAPHTDDGELGCGATIAKLIEKGKVVYYVAFSTCEESIPQGLPKDILSSEVREATETLGIGRNNLIIKDFPVRHFPRYRQEILENLVELRNELNPSLVFTPSSFDVHQDHHTIHHESKRAFKGASILGYELPWNNYSFGSTVFTVVNEEHLELKTAAIDKYESQQHREYVDKTILRANAKLRGLQISEEYAEAFEAIRWIIR